MFLFVGLYGGSVVPKEKLMIDLPEYSVAWPAGKGFLQGNSENCCILFIIFVVNDLEHLRAIEKQAIEWSGILVAQVG